MICPKCQRDKTSVKVTLPYVEGGCNKVLRTRKCTCGHKFNTLETVTDDSVVKKDVQEEQ